MRAAISVFLCAVVHAQVKPERPRIDQTVNAKLDARGDAAVEIKMTFANMKDFDNWVKDRALNKAVIARDFKRMFQSTQMEKFDMDVMHDQRAAKITFNLRGTATCKRGKWSVELGEPKKGNLVTQDKDKMIFSFADELGEYLVTSTVTIALPPDASNAGYDGATSIVTFQMEAKEESSPILMILGAAFVVVGLVTFVVLFLVK